MNALTLAAAWSWVPAGPAGIAITIIIVLGLAAIVYAVARALNVSPSLLCSCNWHGSW